MFYWLVAIPFFVALMMLALMGGPESDNLKQAENLQTDSAVFRMATQHDAAVRYVEAKYAAGQTLTSGTALTKTHIDAYLPDNYVADYEGLSGNPESNYVKSYLVCDTSNCLTATRLNVVTVLDATKGKSYLYTDRVDEFLKNLSRYKSSFPMYKQNGESQSYKGFVPSGGSTSKINITLAGEVMTKAANNGIMMAQKKGDNYILPDELYNFKVGGVSVLADGEPAVITMVGAKLEPQVCSDTEYFDNEDWYGKAAKCSACSKNEVQKRWISANADLYPYTSSISCLPIPSSGSSVVWDGTFTITHRTASISCNGKTETYHLIGDMVSWWMTEEICAKMGAYMPVDTTYLSDTAKCGDGVSRLNKLKTAFSITSDIHVWTKEKSLYYTAVNCMISLYNGSKDCSTGRDGAQSTVYALCGPKS